MTIQVFDRQSAINIDLRRLKKIARSALHEVVQRESLPDFPVVEVAIVADEQIAAVHEQFMHVSGPTDVITFDHGELVISADTALRNSERYGQKLEDELGLYIIHGLLHLCGYEDHRANDARRMRHAQGSILQAVLAGSAT